MFQDKGSVNIREPNISGSAKGMRGATNSFSGVLTLEQVENYAYVGEMPGGILNLEISAAKASAIYGKSSSVQPSSIQILIIIKT